MEPTAARTADEGLVRGLGAGDAALVTIGSVLAIAFLTFVNYLGLREGAGMQNVVTVVKIGSIVGFALFGLMVAAPVAPHLAAPLPPSVTGSALGVAMIAVLWGYDGWYGATFL